MHDVKLGKSEVLCRYCGAPVVNPGAKAFCGAECYHQKRRAQPAEQRFWSKVDRSGDCWVWTASVWNSGYGQFNIPGPDRDTRIVVGAHRYSYELTNGPIPDGLEIIHKCDNRLCVRPDHMRIGTHAENVQDASKKGRLRVPRPRAHRLTAYDIAQIRSLVASGEKQIRVAERFGISKGYVSRIMSHDCRPYDAPIGKAS